MKAEALKGHLDGLILATLAEGPAHGYAIAQRFAHAAAEPSICRRARSTRRSTASSAPA
jgi:hypothetical protein